MVSDSSDKAQDYHFILSFILSSLKDAQEHVGISWKLKYQEKVLDVVMKIPILFVIGDTEGHDKLCGKYLNRVNAECICHYCNTKRIEIQDISTDFKLIAAPLIAEWSETYNSRDAERLKSLSYC